MTESVHTTTVQRGPQSLHSSPFVNFAVTSIGVTPSFGDGALLNGTGLPRRERKEAVQRVLASHPEWADRRIGECCGVSPKTVAGVRRQMAEAGGDDEVGRIDVRVGRDGRLRPVDAAAQRARIVEALKEQPDASLRVIAKAVGVSPETVRRVRMLLGAPEPPATSISPAEVISIRRPKARARASRWQSDAALMSCADGTTTAEFLSQTDVDEQDLDRHARSIPLSRVYEIADEARRRASFWSTLAGRVEARAGSTAAERPGSHARIRR